MSSPVTWNPVRQLWETEQADLFSGQQEPFSETWPTSGMTRSGRLLPLPMSGHPIGGNECSSSQLPTPTASDAHWKTTHAGGNLTLQGAVGGVNLRDAERHAKAGRKVPSAVMNLDELDGLDTVTDTEFLTHPTLTQTLNLE